MHVISVWISAQSSVTKEDVIFAMKRATCFMVDSISSHGGYVWSYLPDHSRQWGELEAYPSMIWLQHPGTLSMGNLFLDAYAATWDEYYYQAAQKVAWALVKGQNVEGGWNYMIDFKGEDSLKKWYDTIGKNAWRLEEFQHYYGNSTFDDNVSVDAARFLLRYFQVQQDESVKASLDLAIQFILESQYPNGAWPQRYPAKGDFRKDGLPDYTAFYTFNDDVIWANIRFMVLCFLTFNEEKYKDSYVRAMDFYLISQHESGAWGQQYDLECRVAGARTYELNALLPSVTYENACQLLWFYLVTGNLKYLKPVPLAIQWLEGAAYLSHEKGHGRYTHPTFVDPETNRPRYVHRKGTNVTTGCYFSDELINPDLAHYHGSCYVPVGFLKTEYERVYSMSKDLVCESQIDNLRMLAGDQPLPFAGFKPEAPGRLSESEMVNRVIHSLDKNGRWLVKHMMTSHPYSFNPIMSDTSNVYTSTFAGDLSDTSPFPDSSEQEYISTSAFIRNMKLMIRFLNDEVTE